MKRKQALLFAIILINIFSSCRIVNIQNYIIKNLKVNNKIDLGQLVNQEYDYLIILDEGTTLKQYDIYDDIESNWLGQKILYFKNNKIIKQVNLSYYISEPNKKNYLTFFNTTKPSEFYIKRINGDSVFHLKKVSKIGKNSFCYFVE